MDKSDIKRVIGRLDPDDEMESRLSEKLSRDYSRKASYKPVAAIAAGLIMIIGTGAFMYFQNGTNAKLGMQNQNIRTDNKFAFEPGSRPIEKSDMTTQDDSAGILDAQTHDNREKEKPENRAIESQDGPAVNSSALQSKSTVNENSEVINNNTETEGSKEMLPKSEINLDTKTLLQNDSVDISKSQLTKNKNEQNEGIYIPKIQLPTDAAITTKMMGLIVYQGRVYIQSPLSEEQNNAKKLVGEKIGKTKGTITEWSAQSDYAVELASTAGIQDVYAVNGYDKSFRIMTYGRINGEVYVNFFDCLNGITVKTGNDIFGKFKIESKIDSVKYEDFDSWNSGKGNYKLLARLDHFNSFLATLENSIPIVQEGLSNVFDDQGSISQKFVYVKLKDGSEVNIRLFKDGYAYYNGVNILFKVEDSALKGLWNELN